jgi:hypothetical protein
MCVFHCNHLYFASFYFICVYHHIHLFLLVKWACKHLSVCWHWKCKALVRWFMLQAHYLTPSHSPRNSHPTGRARGTVAPQGTFWVEALAGHNRHVWTFQLSGTLHHVNWLLTLYSVPCVIKLVNDTNGSVGHTAQAANHTSVTESGYVSLSYLTRELHATALTKISYDKYHRQLKLNAEVS